jgi:hypothetical protein
MLKKIKTRGAPMAQEREEGGRVKVSTFIPLKIRKRGVRKVVIRPSATLESGGNLQFDQPLITALTRAFYWQQLIDERVVANGTEIAKQEGLHHSTVNELLRLTLLDPDIIKLILSGKQPRCMSLLWFQRNPLTVNWQEQREVLARFDGV